jgi:superfamily I DNA and/or RNA helicase
MHPEIAALPRDIIYKGQALMDANTISDRDKVIKWDFASDVFPSRRCWVDVEGSIDKDRVNRDEIKLTELVLKRFLSWAEQRGRPARPAPEYWEVACLAFYNKQADAMARSVARAVGTPDQRGRRFRAGDVEVVVGTVDRFQGREADLVLLSMRNTKQIGFLDSPNRLNVAMTRARQQLVVFGDRDYFLSRRDHAQLHALAERSCLVAPQDLRAP